MSNVTPPAGPGLTNQAAARTTFRLLGVVVTATALVLLVVGGFDFFTSLDSFEGPTRFWMFFLGVPLLGVGGWLLQAGFLGVGARYVSGEVTPVAKDTAEHLTGGKGLTHLGVAEPSGTPAAGPYCRSCGTRNDADARFCDSCGTAMA